MKAGFEMLPVSVTDKLSPGRFLHLPSIDAYVFPRTETGEVTLYSIGVVEVYIIVCTVK